MDSYYQKLLAHNPESKAGILNPGNGGFGGGSGSGVAGGFQTRHPRSLNQQDRSNSAPNVCINNVKSFGAGGVAGAGVGGVLAGGSIGILQSKGPLQVCC